MSLIDAALTYATRGIPVFPVWGVTDDGRCGCGDLSCARPGKHPLGRLVPNGVKGATIDEPTIRTWWEQEPTANIGRPTGDVFVLDVDPGKGGAETLAQLEAQFGALPGAPEVLTGGDGRHIYFVMPAPPLRNSTGKLGPGLDTRGVGGYVLLPPSRHASGRAYRQRPDRPLNGMPLPPMPTWIRGKLETEKYGRAVPFSVPEKILDGQRNDTLYRSGRSMRAKGWSAPAISAALREENEARCQPPLDDSEIAAIIVQVLDQPDRPEFRGSNLVSSNVVAPLEGAAGNDARARLLVTGDLVEMTTAAWPALEVVNTPPSLFRRGAVPVRLERDDDGIPVTRPLTPDRMRHALARASRWWKPRGNSLIEVLPPMPVVFDMLATANPPLPILDRIVEVPTFTASGRLRLEPGYDSDGRTYYDPPPGLSIPSVSERPTADEITTARRFLLEDLLGDFRFIDRSDEAHTVAMMVLPFVRELIDGPTPLHDVEAPGPGNGKTLLVDMGLWASLGRNVPAMAEGRDDDEWRKRISAKLFGAAQVIFLDNLRRRLDSSAVAAAITSPRWEDRVLGRSEIQTVPVRCVWVCSGNNPAFSLEMARRTLRIRIDAGLEQPWLRTGFRHANLREWVRENRPRVIWALLTLIQAWIAAGRPLGTARLGMFESWSSVVGGVLQVAGFEGFLGNLQDFYAEADSETGEIRDFFAAWWEKHRDRPVTAAELLNLSTLPGSILDAPDSSARAKRLGRYIGALRDRRVKLGEAGPTVFAKQSKKKDPKSRAFPWRLQVEGA